MCFAMTIMVVVGGERWAAGKEKEGTKAVEMLVKMHYPCTFEEVS